MNPQERRYNRTQGVSSLLRDHLNRHGMEAKVREYTAPLVWAEMVGPQVAAATEVEKVKNGVLYVRTRSAMWAQELTFYREDILRRLNRRIGARDEPLITDIRFLNRGLRTKEETEKPPPLNPSADELDDVDLSAREREIIEESVARIADEGLRERMRRVRLANARLRTWRLDNGWAPCDECGELAPPLHPYNGDTDCPRCRIQRNTPNTPLGGRR
jgi:predicted nucleic acid-binding Zn ribbon protein